MKLQTQPRRTEGSPSAPQSRAPLPEASRPASAAEPDRTSSPKTPLRLLIIDDEKDLLELIAFRFRKSGDFEVETAADGETGLEKVKSFRPDIVLLDLIMPGLDGWEVCSRLQEDPSTERLPVVVMTAVRFGPPGDPSHARGRRIVFKPFNDGDILDIVREEARY